MQHSTKISMALAVISFVLTAFVLTTAVASEKISYSDLGDLSNGKAIFDKGKGDVPACNTCHGADAMGDDNMGTPRLAAQGFSFLVKQLEDFATDKRMDTTMYIMNINAKGLTPQDRKDVAAYVASLQPASLREVGGSDMEQVKGIGSTPIGVRYIGKALAQYGAPERGIPACHSCHGYNGRGAFPVYPRIGGQKYVYLTNQLKKWRDGTRANDPLSQMQKVAQKMTDEDIYNVSVFLTNAPLTTKGNARVPYQY